jgi:response regulator NasT
MSFSLARVAAPLTYQKPELIPDRPARILIAEDEHLVAADLTAMLADDGYAPILATDGQEALDLARTAHPDMAILDIRMPRKDGLAAARELYYELGIPVIIVSAYSTPEEATQAQEAGVFGYLVKPVHPAQLRVGIDVAWQRFRVDAMERLRGETLVKRLEDRKVIEQAKWILVSTRSLTEPEAMKALQKQARDGRIPLAEVALDVVKQHPQ